MKALGARLLNRRLRALIHEICSGPEGAAGCCLHIVIDDGNTGDTSVRYCLEQAEARRHARCADAAGALLIMTRKQRRDFLRPRRKARS